MMDQGLLLARLVLGLLMAGHGAQKLFGWFGGYGLAGVSGFFEGLGFRPGRLFAIAAAGSEVVSGLLMAAGFLGPIGPALMLSVMILAAVSGPPKNGMFANTTGRGRPAASCDGRPGPIRGAGGGASLAKYPPPPGAPRRGIRGCRSARIRTADSRP